MTGPGSSPQIIDDQARVFPVSPLLIRPWRSGLFSVYLKQDDRFVLYARQGEAFSAKHRQRLFEMGLTQVYVLKEQQNDYESYLGANLGDLLGDEDIPLRERAGALRAASGSVIQKVFDHKLPRTMEQERLKQLQRLVAAGVRFFQTPEAMLQLSKLVSHDYQLYAHGLNCMVLTVAMLQTYEGVEDELMIGAGVGAVLHDYGKSRIPKTILNRPLESLSLDEWNRLKSHPNLGASLCAAAPLTPEIVHCILFHHEQENGKGYPSSITGESIPFYVKVLSVANLYDNLTTSNRLGKAVAPFQALKIMREREGQFDMDAFRRLVMVLADAKITPEA